MKRVAWRKLNCWVCGHPFAAARSTAMCCSAACRKARSRFAAANGRFPREGEMRPWFTFNNRREGEGRHYAEGENQ